MRKKKKSLPKLPEEDSSSSSAVEQSPLPPKNGCICPEGCLIGSEIDSESTENAIHVICSAGDRCWANPYIHVECQEKWETYLWQRMEHKSGQGQPSAWSRKHALNALWSGSKKYVGYQTIFKLCKCPCGGYLRRDMYQMDKVGFVSLEEKASPENKKVRKKPKQLPSLVEEGRVNIKNVTGISGSRFSAPVVRRFSERKVDNSQPPPSKHFWDIPTRYESKIVGESPVKQKGTSSSLSSTSENFSVQAMPEKLYVDTRPIHDSQSFFSALWALLEGNGKKLVLTDRLITDLLDRISHPLSKEVFALCRSVWDWISIFGPSEIYVDGQYLRLRTCDILAESSNKVASPQKQWDEETEWKIVSHCKYKTINEAPNSTEKYATAIEKQVENLAIEEDLLANAKFCNSSRDLHNILRLI